MLREGGAPPRTPTRALQTARAEKLSTETGQLQSTKSGKVQKDFERMDSLEVRGNGLWKSCGAARRPSEGEDR
jgi:hypothetical protein